MTLESSLARRFKDIEVDESDLPYLGWCKFWNDGAVLMIKWVDGPDTTIKIVALLKEMPEV